MTPSFGAFAQGGVTVTVTMAVYIAFSKSTTRWDMITALAAALAWSLLTGWWMYAKKAH